MALLDVVFRLLNKSGDDFVEPRREDGHGSTVANPTHVSLDGTVTITQAQIDSITTILTRIDQNTDTLEIAADSIALNADQIQLNTDTVEANQLDILAELQAQQKDALTDVELRASPVEVRNGATLHQLDRQLLGTEIGQVTQTVIHGASPQGGGAYQDVKVDGSGQLLVVATESQMTGTWGYAAGQTGTPTIPVDSRILKITAIGGIIGASLQINGGDIVPLPAGTSLTIEPRGNLVDPTIVFSGTASYFVEYVSGV